MDPNTCLTELLQALQDGDREATVERAESLARWVDLGGFLPTVSVHGRYCRLGPDTWPGETSTTVQTIAHD